MPTHHQHLLERFAKEEAALQRILSDWSNLGSMYSTIAYRCTYYKSLLSMYETAESTQYKPMLVGLPPLWLAGFGEIKNHWGRFLFATIPSASPKEAPDLYTLPKVRNACLKLNNGFPRAVRIRIKWESPYFTQWQEDLNIRNFMKERGWEELHKTLSETRVVR